MSGVCGAIGCALVPVKTFLYDNTKNYVGYIGSCENNLRSLRKNLSDVCNKKDDISQKVKEGEDKLERITREAARWLEDVRLLTGEVDIKSLMHTDIETAKFVVKLMGKTDLKNLLKDGDMQKLVVEVMDMLKQEMDKSEDRMRVITTVDYKMVAEVVVEVMKDTTEEFKKLMKKDKKMAVIAIKMLTNTDLDKLTKDDKEMQEIVSEARSEIDADEDEEESDVLIVTEEVPVNENVILKAAKKLVVPLENLLSLAGKLMDDADFKKAVPEAVDVKLGLDIIDGLLLKNGGFKKAMDENTRQHENCCCFCAFVPSYYHSRYKVSIAAETLAKRIDNDIIKNCPGHPVTVSIRLIDMKQSPTQFLKGLQSRDRLLQEILQILRDDQDHVVGLYGMGGCGKTTLADEVAYVGVDMFSIMVEITECPDIRRIQGTIAAEINLPLREEHNIRQRAKILHNRLNSEKEKKILIILDNIWDKLDLHEVGIPNTCKLLLTTREKDVCRKMGVRDANTRQVPFLDAIEGKSLLCSQVGDIADSKEYKTVIGRLLAKCEGLPLAIVVTANALKGKDLPNWRKFADDLEKPVSFQLPSGGHRVTYIILLTSYRFIESKEKRMFFLLCCLWCLHSYIPFKAVMRCGIGLDLYPHANKLSEMVDQGDRWADELMSSSMLLKPDRQGFLKIHDVVRDFGITFAAEDDKHKFLVDAIPRGLNKKALTECTAISLLGNSDYSRLNGINSNKLQILLLESTKIWDSPSSFSGTMMNLEVLNLNNMNFRPKLPEFIGKLVKLRTLSLEDCWLGDIKVIGELVNLVVLSLRDSYLKELPDEIGKLINLWLLDLTKCLCTYRPDLANILGGLSELEGLFMCNYGGTSYAPLAFEFSNMHHLNALEMHIWCAEQLSVDAQFVKNLDSFRIFINYKGNNYRAPQVGSFLRILDVEEVNMGEIIGKRTFKALLKKADWIWLRNSSNFSILFDELDNEGLPELRHLEVKGCNDVTFIVNLRGKNDLLVFHNLHSLKLDSLPELKGIYDGEAPPGIFSNLQHLSILGLKNLHYVLPFDRAPCKLTEIKVGACESLKFIFIEQVIGDGRHAGIEETYVMELPSLKLLDLRNLDHFSSLLGSASLSEIGDDMQEHQVFFSPRMMFSSLEELLLSECKRIVKLWYKDLGISSFQSLRTIKIVGCEDLSSLGPLSLFSTLLQLESLTIEKCKSMIEVITSEGTEELEECDQVVIFPHLKDLVIRSSSNLKSFYRGKCILKFPNLKILQLSDLDCLDKFAGSENQSVLFHKEIVFSSLEEFSLKNCQRIVKLWDKDLGVSSFQSLRTIKISNLQLSSIGSLSIFSTLVQLERLTIEACKSMHEIINTEGTAELEALDQVVIIPQLKVLVISNSSNLKSFYGGKCKLKFPNLRSLHLSRLKCLNKFAGLEDQSVLFHKEMDFPFLEELSVSYINDKIMGLWDWRLEGGSTPLLNYVPRLRKLTVIKTNRWMQIPSVIYKNLSFLEYEKFNDELLLSKSYEGSVWTYSQLPKLKDLYVKNSKSLKDLLSIEDFETAAALTFCEQLKNLELIDLPRLKIVPLHLFKSLCSLRLQILSWEYLFSADTFVRLQDSLQQLESLYISDCENMRVVIQDDGEGNADVVYKFPRLKEISLFSCSVVGFSTTVNATLCLPSVEKIYIYGCHKIQHFWSGPFIAPKLKEVTVMWCKTIKWVLVEHSNYMVELPSLMKVLLSQCPAVFSFSCDPFEAPNLRQVERVNCSHTPSLTTNTDNVTGYSMDENVVFADHVSLSDKKGEFLSLASGF